MEETPSATKSDQETLTEAENARRLRGLKRANGIGQWLGYKVFRATILAISNMFMQGKIINLDLLPQPHANYYPPFYRRLSSKRISDYAFVVAPNHQHVLDISLTGIIRRPMIWPSKPAFVKWRWLKSMNQAMGCAPFMRDIDWEKNPQFAVLAYTKDEIKDLVQKALCRGQPAVIYPQGTRRSDGALDEAKLGAMHASVRAGVALVPLAIYGLTRGDEFRRTPILRRRKVVGVVMPPLYPYQYPDASNNDELARLMFTDWVRAIEDGRKLAKDRLTD